MPNEIEFSEDAPANGGIDFLPDEEVAKFAITAPQEVANTVMRTLTNPAVGIGAEQARDYSARERAMEKQLDRPMGGGVLDMPYVGPDTSAQLRSAAGAVGRAIEAPLTGMARAATQIVNPVTFLPEEQQAPLRPFVINERDRAEGQPAELRHMTRQEAEARAPLQPGVPLIPVRGTELQPEGSDMERLISQNSTPGNIAMIAAGGASKVIGGALLASMVPGVVEDIAEVAGGSGSMDQKRERINQLLIPAFLALKHGGGFELKKAIRDLPPPIRRGIQPVPDARGRFVTPEGERRILAPEIIDEPAIPGPLPLTGAELPGRPKGFVPAVPTAGPVELGPAAPPRVRRPEVPEGGTPERSAMLAKHWAIRQADARTRAQIMELFPELSREQAAELRNSVWGKPNADLGVIVSPTGEPTPAAEPTRPSVKAPEAEPAEQVDPAQAEEARQAAIDRSNLEQGIITQQRELEKALAAGDVRAQNEATRKLMALRKAYEGPPEPVKPPIKPKAPLPNVPRGTFAPEVPGTPAEVREPIVQEIQRRNLRTRQQVVDAFPSLLEGGQSREKAAELLRKAWGTPQPPEGMGPYGQVNKPGAGGPKIPEVKPGEEPPPEEAGPAVTAPKPKPPPADAGGARTLPDYDPEDLGMRERIKRKMDAGMSRDAAVAEIAKESGAVESEIDKLPPGTRVRNKNGQLYENMAQEGERPDWVQVDESTGDIQKGSVTTSQNLRGGKVERLGTEKPKGSTPEAAAPKSLEETSLSDFNQNLDKFLDDQGIPRNSWPTDLREKVFSLLKEDAIKNRDELNTLLEQVEGAEALQEMGLMPKPKLSEAGLARLRKKVARMPKEKLDSPHDLEPALMVDGEPVSGGVDHNDIYNSIISEEGASDARIGEAFDALKDDARHVFVDKEGRIYSREQAAKALGETEPLQSRRLRELQKNAPKPGAKPSEPTAPEGIEGTVIAGKTLAEWEAVTDASGLPRGEARAELAKWLAVPNQPSRILQALANKKRTREIHAPPTTDVEPVTSEARASTETAAEHIITDKYDWQKDTSIEAKLWGAAHSVQGAEERWAKLRASGATDQQIKDALSQEFGIMHGSSSYGGFETRGQGNPRLWDKMIGKSKNPTLSGKALIKMAREVLEIPEPKAESVPPEIAKTEAETSPVASTGTKKPVVQKPREVGKVTMQIKQEMEAMEPGQCFANARKWAMKNGGTVVHGKMTVEGNRFDHAWVEQGEDVVDPTAGIRVDKAEFYRATKAESDATYTPEKATALLVRANHGGPYTKAEAEGFYLTHNGAEPALAEGTHPIDTQMGKLGIKGYGKTNDKGVFITPPLTPQQFTDLIMLADNVGWTTTGQHDMKGKKILGEFVRKPSEQQMKIKKLEGQINTLRAFYQDSPSLNKGAPERIAQLEKELEELRKGKDLAEGVAENDRIKTNPKPGDVIKHPDYGGDVRVIEVGPDRVNFEILSGEGRGLKASLPLKEWREDLTGKAEPPPEPGAPDPRRAALTEAGLDAFDLDRLARITGMSQDQWLDQTTIEKNHDAAIYAADKPRLLAMEEAIDEKDTRKVRALWDASFPPDHFVRRLFQAITKAKDPWEWGKTLEGKAPEAEPSQEWKDKVGLKGPIRPAPSKELKIPPPVEVQGELYEFTPEEVKKANLACRVCGAVGAGAITPKYVQRTSSRTETILDFGAGDQAPHTATLRNDGFNVTAYEFGQNVVEGIHDPNALERKYDTVFASNVLNVQSGRPMLRATLKEIFDATGGRALFNYPRKPRYSSLSTTEVAAEIESIFGVKPTRVGGTPDAPIWEVRTDGKTPESPREKVPSQAEPTEPKPDPSIPPELLEQHKALKAQIDAIVLKMEQTKKEPYDPERNVRLNLLQNEAQPLADKLKLLENQMFDLRWQAETAKFRGKVETPPSEPKITTKELRTQKEFLLEQVDQAIKDAPEKGKGKIKISVPGDGEFIIDNTKERLRNFREAAKGFPSTVEKPVAKIGGTQASTTKRGTATPLPKATDPKPEERNKVLGRAVGTDPTREALHTVYSDGQQMIATDGRQMVRVVGDDLPGTIAAPLRLSPEGRPTKETSHFPNYNTILSGTPRLVLGGFETANLWHLAKQADNFASLYEKQGSVELFLNADRSLGARMKLEGDSFEHNVQAGAKTLGHYNPEYLFNMAETARRLGNEKADLYADREEGPLELVGKNHQHLLMPMGGAERVNRVDPKTIPATLSGKALHTRPAPGLPPLSNPEGLFEAHSAPYTVELEGGEYTIKRTTKVGREDVENEILRVSKGEATAGDIATALGKELGQEIPASHKDVATIKRLMSEAAKERQKVVDEGKARLAKLPKPPKGISMGPGAASPEEFSEARPSSVGIDPGNDAWNRAIRHLDNFLSGVRQLFTRSGFKQDFSQLANAADNIPRMIGQQAGNAIRLRTEAPDRRAITFLMQALKMSGDGLSVDDAARMGELEFQGDPQGYLRTKKTDMETKAQEFLKDGLKIESQAALDAAHYMGLALQKYNALMPVARRVKAMLDAQWAREQRAGVPVDYERWYVPQRHELELLVSDNKPIVLGHSKGTGTAAGFRKAKVYEDYATAIENGFAPRNLDIADLLENRVFQGERLIQRKVFFDQLRRLTDPVDGKAVVTRVPRRVITRQDGTVDVQETIPLGYEMYEPMPGMRLAIHQGYARLLKALTGTSQIAESAVVGTLSDIAAIEKHLTLAIDTFHASRTLQAELALTYKASVGEHQRRGLALVEYRPQDLNLAAEKGLITQEMADWVKKPQPMQIGGKTVKLSPHSVIVLGAKNGLNMARVADVMYREWIRELPIVGDVQKWVFDKATRSAISQSFLHEFERVAQANPHLNATQVARTVASDINVFFGNLGKESIFKNPSLRTINNILFLAPQWVEALARREARAVKQAGGTVLDAFRGKPIRVGTAAKGIGTGLAAYFVATQLLNLWTRGHLTFQNPEEGHKLDAYIPPIPGLEPGGKKGRGGFISPLSVFGEITHNLLYYFHQKPDMASALSQIGENKFGNIARFLQVLGTGRDPLTGEKLIGTGRRALTAGAQLAPIPIIASQSLKRFAAQEFPGMTQAPPPGASQRQMLASFGFKTEPAPTATMETRRMVDAWKSSSKNAAMRAQIERRLKEDFGPSDYRDLRSSLARGDLPAAERAYQQLLETKKPEDIRNTMAHPHPFTGSRQMESLFLHQLTPEQTKTYRAAIQERTDLNRKFQEMLRDYYRRRRQPE